MGLKYFENGQFGGTWWFLAVAAVSLPFLHSPLINIRKATAMLNISVVSCNSLFGLVPALFLRSCNTTPPIFKVQ